MKGLKVWPISASVNPTAWKREDPGCQGNLDFRLRRQWRLLGLPSHSHVGHSGSPHSWPGPGCWPLPLPWANRAPPSQGRESYCLPGHCGSLVVAHILRNFCFPLIPALSSTPFVINDIHLTPCSLPRTFHVISHLIVGPVLAVGRGSVQQSSEIRSLRTETSQVSGSFRDPRPGPFPSAQPSLSSASLVSGPRPYGAKTRNPVVLEQAYLGSARSLLFLQREAFLQAPLTSGEPPRYSLPSASPHHLASASLSSHSLWYQLQQYSQNS